MKLAPLLLALAVAACDGGAPAPSAGEIFRSEERGYRVVVEGSPDGARLRASVEPRGHYHLSTEFPSKLELAGATLARDEAAVLTEERVEFAAPRPEPPAAGALTFGLCEDDLCERITEPFELR